VIGADIAAKERSLEFPGCARIKYRGGSFLWCAASRSV